MMASPRQGRFGAVRFGGYVILVEGRGIAPMPFAAFAELPDVGVGGLAESHAVRRQCIQQRVGDRTNLTRHDIETKFRQGRAIVLFPQTSSRTKRVAQRSFDWPSRAAAESWPSLGPLKTCDDVGGQPVFRPNAPNEGLDAER
jgi:hypothetical protein